MKQSELLEDLSQDLVGEAQQGNQKALDQLIRLHEPFIYNVAKEHSL